MCKKIRNYFLICYFLHWILCTGNWWWILISNRWRGYYNAMASLHTIIWYQFDLLVNIIESIISTQNWFDKMVYMCMVINFGVIQKISELIDWWLDDWSGQNVWKNDPKNCGIVMKFGAVGTQTLWCCWWLTDSVGIRTHYGTERHTTIEYSKNRDRNRTNILWLFLLLVICHLMKYKATYFDWLEE